MRFAVTKIGDGYNWHFRWYSLVEDTGPEPINYFIKELGEIDTDHNRAIAEVFVFLRDRGKVTSVNFTNETVTMLTMIDHEIILSSVDTIELKLKYGEFIDIGN